MSADTPDVGLTEQIAALLSKHIFTLYPDALGCDCDWSTDEGNDNQRIDAWTEHVAVVLAARVAAERERADAAEARWAHVVRNHTMPPNKDSRGYDYRMGWWDAILLADRIMQRRVRICDDCPDDHLRAALGGEGAP